MFLVPSDAPNVVRYDHYLALQADGITPASGLAVSDISIVAIRNTTLTTGTVLADDGRADAALPFGTFLIQELGSSGRYSIRWRTHEDPGYARLDVDIASLTQRHSVEVSIVLGITAPSATEAITLIANMPDGTGVSNAGYTVRSSTGTLILSGVLNENGRATLALPIGTGYKVLVSRVDLSFDTATFSVAAGGGTVTVVGKIQATINFTGA